MREQSPVVLGGGSRSGCHCMASTGSVGCSSPSITPSAHTAGIRSGPAQRRSRPGDGACWCAAPVPSKRRSGVMDERRFVRLIGLVGQEPCTMRGQIRIIPRRSRVDHLQAATDAQHGQPRARARSARPPSRVALWGDAARASAGLAVAHRSDIAAAGQHDAFHAERYIGGGRSAHWVPAPATPALPETTRKCGADKPPGGGRRATSIVTAKGRMGLFWRCCASNRCLRHLRGMMMKGARLIVGLMVCLYHALRMNRRRPSSGRGPPARAVNVHLAAIARHALDEAAPAARCSAWERRRLWWAGSSTQPGQPARVVELERRLTPPVTPSASSLRLPCCPYCPPTKTCGVIWLKRTSGTPVSLGTPRP